MTARERHLGRAHARVLRRTLSGHRTLTRGRPPGRPRATAPYRGADCRSHPALPLTPDAVRPRPEWLAGDLRRTGRGARPVAAARPPRSRAAVRTRCCSRRPSTTPGCSAGRPGRASRCTTTAGRPAPSAWSRVAWSRCTRPRSASDALATRVLGARRAGHVRDRAPARHHEPARCRGDEHPRVLTAARGHDVLRRRRRRRDIMGAVTTIDDLLAAARARLRRLTPHEALDAQARRRAPRRRPPGREAPRRRAHPGRARRRPQRARVAPRPRQPAPRPRGRRPRRAASSSSARRATSRAWPRRRCRTSACTAPPTSTGGAQAWVAAGLPVDPEPA